MRARQFKQRLAGPIASRMRPASCVSAMASGDQRLRCGRFRRFTRRLDVWLGDPAVEMHHAVIDADDIVADAERAPAQQADFVAVGVNVVPQFGHDAGCSNRRADWKSA